MIPSSCHHPLRACEVAAQHCSRCMFHTERRCKTGKKSGPHHLLAVGAVVHTLAPDQHEQAVEQCERVGGGRVDGGADGHPLLHQ